MEEQVLALIRQLCAPAMEDEGLRTLCRAACARLDSLLADGVTAADCGERYPLAAAWMVMDWMEGCGGLDGVTAISAGDMTVRRESGCGGARSRRAMELLEPWLRARGFVFQGV